MPLEYYYEPLDIDGLKRAMNEMVARDRQLARARAARVGAFAADPIDLAFRGLMDPEDKKKNQ